MKLSENGKPCGSIRHKSKWVYFCGLNPVDNMCQHAQLRQDLFLKAYNENKKEKDNKQ